MKARESITEAQVESGALSGRAAAVVVRADAPWPAGHLVFADHAPGADEELELDIPNEHIVIPAVLLN